MVHYMVCYNGFQSSVNESLRLYPKTISNVNYNIAALQVWCINSRNQFASDLEVFTLNLQVLHQTFITFNWSNSFEFLSCCILYCMHLQKQHHQGHWGFYVHLLGMVTLNTTYVSEHEEVNRREKKIYFISQLISFRVTTQLEYSHY